MPLLVTYGGRRVKRRRRVGQCLKIRFYAPIPGQPGPAIVVSQAEWNRHGCIQMLPKEPSATSRAF